VCVNDTTLPDAFVVRYSADIKEDNTTGARMVDYDAKRGTGVDCLGNEVKTDDVKNPLLLVENRFFVKENPSTKRKELYCVGSADLLSGAQPVVEGVEDLVLRYGVDRQGTGTFLRDMAGDAFVSAKDVLPLEWQFEDLSAAAVVARSRRVIAVEACVLMRSSERGTGSQSYTDCRGNTQTSTDGYLRQPFKSTFVLRNHVGDPV
jgi:Type IV Pilus-assembly protein W